MPRWNSIRNKQYKSKKKITRTKNCTLKIEHFFHLLFKTIYFFEVFSSSKFFSSFFRNWNFLEHLKEEKFRDSMNDKFGKQIVWLTSAIPRISQCVRQLNDTQSITFTT